MSKLLIGPLLAWAKTLRYPTLFKLTAALFVFSLLLPPGLDPVPLLDEIMLGLGTLLLANWHRRKEPIDTAAQAPKQGGTVAPSKPPIDLPRIN